MKFELGERDDVVVDPVDVLPREPQERPVEIDVLAARELLMETGAELQQSASLPWYRIVPDVGRRIPAMHFSSVVPEPLCPISPATSPRLRGRRT